jgi:hypothetical protein
MTWASPVRGGAGLSGTTRDSAISYEAGAMAGFDRSHDDAAAESRIATLRKGPAGTNKKGDLSAALSES